VTLAVGRQFAIAYQGEFPREVKIGCPAAVFPGGRTYQLTPIDSRRAEPQAPLVARAKSAPLQEYRRAASRQDTETPHTPRYGWLAKLISAG